jgi:hypothetical protein
MRTAKLALLSSMFLCLFVSQGCQKFSDQANAEKLQFKIKTPFQVVFLDNNNAYIGQMLETGKDFIKLTNVYYIQTQQNTETKEVKNTLIKRGNELHRPDLMLINMQHVIMIEPVTPDSQVAKLIAQSEIQNQPETRQRPEEKE